MVYSIAVLFICILALVVWLVFNGLKKGASSIKVMLLGINITLLGGILAVDPNSNLSGFEYLIVLAGLMISLAGLNKKD